MGLFLLIAVGFLAVRLKVMPAEASKPLSSMLMKITLPATVFASLIRPFDAEFIKLGLIAIGLSLLFFSLFSALSLPLSRLFRVPDGRRGMWCCCASYSNTGFMGFPVVYALFGDEGLILAVLINIPFNFLLYTVGVWMVCKDVQGAKGRFSLRSVLISPLNAGILLGPDLLLWPTIPPGGRLYSHPAPVPT